MISAAATAMVTSMSCLLIIGEDRSSIGSMCVGHVLPQRQLIRLHCPNAAVTTATPLRHATYCDFYATPVRRNDEVTRSYGRVAVVTAASVAVFRLVIDFVHDVISAAEATRSCCHGNVT